MKDQTICLIPIGFIEKALLKDIAEPIERAFRFPVRILPAEQIPTHTPGLLHDGKYNSTALLLYLTRNNRIPEHAVKVLAVTKLDLYSPIFSHLYGEAQLRGTCALMSLYRLRPEFYEQPPDPALFLSRCRKEAIHELGHTFGLMHCHDTNCIMHPSSTIDDTDTKSESFCPVCEKMRQVCPPR